MSPPPAIAKIFLKKMRVFQLNQLLLNSTKGFAKIWNKHVHRRLQFPCKERKILFRTTFLSSDVQRTLTISSKDSKSNKLSISYGI